MIKGFTYDVTELSSTDDNQTDPNVPDPAQSKSVSISNDGNDESTTIEGQDDAKSTTSQNDAKLNTTEEDAKLTRSQDDAKLATIHSQDDIKSTTIQSIEDRKSTTSENDEKITTSSQEDATAAIKDDKIDSVPNETKPKQENRILEDIEVDLQEYNKKKAEEKERCVHSLIRLSVSQCVR